MGFESCHPAVNFLFFGAVLLGTLIFHQPVFLCIGFISAFLYSTRYATRRTVRFYALLFLAFVAISAYYALYHHFGVTVLFYNLIGNRVTVEAIACACTIAASICGACMWLYCAHRVITADKILYLFAALSPKLSLFLSCAMRMIPRLKTWSRKMHTARKGIGRGAGQGSLFQRLKNTVSLFSMLITWVIEALKSLSDAMMSRGSSLPGRTAFSRYHWDGRDWGILLAMVLCMTLTMMAWMLEQTQAVFDPRILIMPTTPVSYLFYAGYAGLCLMPLGLDMLTHLRWERARRCL